MHYDRYVTRFVLVRGSLDDLFQGIFCGHECEGAQDQVVTTDMDTLATARYVKTDDLLNGIAGSLPVRQNYRHRPEVGRC